MTVNDLYMTIEDLNAFSEVSVYYKTGTPIIKDYWGNVVDDYGEKEVLTYCFRTKRLVIGGVHHARIN